MARHTATRFRFFLIILGVVYFIGLYFFHMDQHQDDHATFNEPLEGREALQIVKEKLNRLKIENKEKKMLLQPFRLQEKKDINHVNAQLVNIDKIENKQDNKHEQTYGDNDVVHTDKNDYNENDIAAQEVDIKAQEFTNEDCDSQNKHLLREYFVALPDQYDKKDLWVYSAYLDERKSEGAFIRMMVLANRRIKPRHKVFCELRNNTTVEGIYYELCENHGKNFGGFIVSCPIPESIKQTPCNINVFIKKHNGHVGIKVKIPIDSTEILPQRDDFGICVPPLFGNIDKHRLIEFIEMSLIFGATKFVFYDFKLTPEIENVLNYYIQRGVVDLVKWHLPHEKQVYYKAQILAVNECLYRKMASIRYVAFQDIDELIVPRQHDNVPNMMSELAVDDNVAFCLESAFFDPQHNNELQSSQLISVQHRTRTTRYHKVRRKCIVEPQKIFEQGIHHISKQNEEHYQIIKLDPDVAVLHHYRKCMRDFGMNCDKFIDDDWIDQYSQQLTHNFNLALNDINRSPLKVYVK